MCLLEAPCAKTLWRALLFRTIFGITRALIVCFDKWRFKQALNSETGFGGNHCDFEQHVPYEFHAPGASILWGATVPWQCAYSFGGGGGGGGASIREGASNRDITVYMCVRVRVCRRARVCVWGLGGGVNNGHHSLPPILGMTLMAKQFEYHYTPIQRCWWGGVYTSFSLSLCPSVQLSVCRQNCVRSVSSTVLTRSISHLHVISSNFILCNCV